MAKRDGRINMNSKITGVFADDSFIYIVAVEKRDDELSIVYAEKSSRGDWLSDESNLFEELSLLVAKNDLPKRNIAFVLPQENIFTYEKLFSDMPSDEKKIRDILFWDMEVNVPYEEGAYHFAYEKLNRGGDYLLAAAEKSLVQETTESALQNELKITALGAEKDEYEIIFGAETIVFESREFTLKTNGDILSEHGIMSALYGVLSAMGEGVDFLPKISGTKAGTWNFFTAVTVFWVIVFLASLFFANEYRIKKLDEQIAKSDETLTLYKSDREIMQRLLKLKAEYDKANDVMLELSKERKSLYTLLTGLGTANSTGITLTATETDESGTVTIKGRAKNYETLMRYIDELKDGKELFVGGAQLDKAEISDKGEVVFAVKGKR